MKSYENIIKSIDKSRSVKIANFIYGLGISGVGLSRAKLICNNFNNNYETLKQLSCDDLIPIKDIGEIVAKDWVLAFENENFVKEVDNVVLELNFIDSDKVEAVLESKTFVITGSVEQFKNRDELVEYIESFSGKVVKAISSKVDYLINNDVNSTSNKNKQAKELGIEVISEKELLELIENR